MGMDGSGADAWTQLKSREFSPHCPTDNPVVAGFSESGIRELVKIKERSNAVRGIVATPLATTLGPSLLSRSSSVRTGL